MGECFFWYWPTRVVPDKRPLNGCVCACVCAFACVCALYLTVIHEIGVNIRQF